MIPATGRRLLATGHEEFEQIEPEFSIDHPPPMGYDFGLRRF